MSGKRKRGKRERPADAAPVAPLRHLTPGRVHDRRPPDSRDSPFRFLFEWKKSSLLSNRNLGTGMGTRSPLSPLNPKTGTGPQIPMPKLKVRKGIAVGTENTGPETRTDPVTRTGIDIVIRRGGPKGGPSRVPGKGAGIGRSGNGSRGTETGIGIGGGAGPDRRTGWKRRMS